MEGRVLNMHLARTLVSNVFPLLPSHAPEKLAKLSALAVAKSRQWHSPTRNSNRNCSSAKNNDLTSASTGATGQTRQYVTTAALEPFLNGSSSIYVEDMYNAWLKDPKSVHAVSTDNCTPIFF